MKTSLNSKQLRLGTLALGLISSSMLGLHAQTIISDGFSGTAGATLDGRTPDTTDLPGTTFVTGTQATSQPSQPTINGTIGDSAPGANTGFNSSAAISIASQGTYIKPTEVTISADVEVNNLDMNVNSPDARGLGLGFFSTTPVTNGNSGPGGASGFYGLLLEADGSLDFVSNGSLTSASVAPFTGFSSTSFYTLSYSVSTVTGSISNVEFNGNNDSSAFASDLIPAGATDLSGFYGSSALSGSATGYVDNFQVTGPNLTTPEPATYALLGLGLLALAFLHRRIASKI